MRREKKGTFSDLRLTVARKYIEPVSRNPMILLGLFLICLVLVFAVFNFFLQDATFLSNGPLSSSHASLEEDCGACHDRFQEVTSENCSVCHEKHGDRLGVYTFTSHYVYRSGDFARAVPSANESRCAACHLEHRGRQAEVTEVSDMRCQICHEFASFNDGHPPFEVAAEPEDAGLFFPHITHVRELMEREELADVEKTCLYCHNAQSDGKSFAPISFDRHCDACHLTATERTPIPLPIEAESAPDPGVLTLADIRERKNPGTEWTLFMSPAEFRERGGEVTKSPVYHQDPWIEENLRELRRRLYQDPGLADLLKASAEAPPEELPALYEEAVTTLESYTLGLRARPEPEIQQELRQIEEVLDALRRSLEDPLTPLDETKFLLALEERRPELTPDETLALEALVNDLTAVCQQCHPVERATIARVKKDQRALTRAEFDHRAHILQVRCLECHYQIPIAENLDLAVFPDVEPSEDQASIQNLPSIETCQQCHTASLASNRCVTCHYFHPNKSRRSEMLLYLDGAGP